MENKDPKPTFTIVNNSYGQKGIKCLLCNRTSWNPNDVENKYCGNCHLFHDFATYDITQRILKILLDKIYVDANGVLKGYDKAAAELAQMYIEQRVSQ
jgi:hypothetical protein